MSTTQELMRVEDKDEILAHLERCEEKHGKVTENMLRDDPNLVHPYYPKKLFGTLSEAKLQADLDDVGQIHLTDEKLGALDEQVRNDTRTEDIIIGLLMGDGWVGEDPGKDGSCLTVEMVNKPFLEWVRCKLGDLVSYVNLKATASELAEKNRSYGYTVNEKNYNDLYALRTRRVPALKELRSWYVSGEKVFPEDLSLTPMKLKVWYCCDGSFNTANNSAVIYLDNEVEREEYLTNLFEEIGIGVAVGTQQVHFTVEQTKELLDYMGEAPPGFNYKWL